MNKKSNHKRAAAFILIGCLSALIIDVALGHNAVVGYMIGMVAAYVILER